MGRPPPHVIFKRVVKGLMRDALPDGIEQTYEAHSKLQLCWDGYGVGAKECKGLEESFNLLQSYNNQYLRYVNNIRFYVSALRYLAPAKRKYDYKGRHGSRFKIKSNTEFQLRNIDISTESDFDD